MTLYIFYYSSNLFQISILEQPFGPDAGWGFRVFQGDWNGNISFMGNIVTFKVTKRQSILSAVKPVDKGHLRPVACHKMLYFLHFIVLDVNSLLDYYNNVYIQIFIYMEISYDVRI
jgi:hypothetical protein